MNERQERHPRLTIIPASGACVQVFQSEMKYKDMNKSEQRSGKRRLTITSASGHVIIIVIGYQRVGVSGGTDK
jgi:hypothetical protein